MKIYELTYIVSPEITSEDVETKSKEVELAITSRDGAIIKQLNPAAKALSYPIGKYASGFFGALEFQLEPEKLAELEEIIYKDEKIIRHIIIVKEAAELRKEKRVRKSAKAKPAPIIEIEKKAEDVSTDETEKVESEEEENPKKSKNKEVKDKVELKDIEQELDQILGE